MIVLEVPYYKQEKWYTCGPACLRMLLKYIGTTPLQLVKGSKFFGFPDIPDGQNAKCSIDRFMQAWSALKCWVIKLQKVKQ